MTLYIGSDKVEVMHLGDTNVPAAYLGPSQVFPDNDAPGWAFGDGDTWYLKNGTYKALVYDLENPRVTTVTVADQYSRGSVSVRRDLRTIVEGSTGLNGNKYSFTLNMNFNWDDYNPESSFGMFIPSRDYDSPNFFFGTGIHNAYRYLVTDKTARAVSKDKGVQFNYSNPLEEDGGPETITNSISINITFPEPCYLNYAYLSETGTGYDFPIGPGSTQSTASFRTAKDGEYNQATIFPDIIWNTSAALNVPVVNSWKRTATVTLNSSTEVYTYSAETENAGTRVPTITLGDLADFWGSPFKEEYKSSPVSSISYNASQVVNWTRLAQSYISDSYLLRAPYNATRSDTGEYISPYTFTGFNRTEPIGGVWSYLCPAFVRKHKAPETQDNVKVFLITYQDGGTITTDGSLMIATEEYIRAFIEGSEATVLPPHLGQVSYTAQEAPEGSFEDYLILDAFKNNPEAIIS